MYVLLAAGFGCVGGESASQASDDPCTRGDGAPASCLEPTQTPAYYVEQSSMYFDTMDYTVELDGWPVYAEQVARWEWPPWLKLTAFGKDHIEATDTVLQLYPSVVQERDCRFFEEQPFGRCRVVFYYDDHGGQGCPIYEEFTFNDAGEITWIEAWSDLPTHLPADTAADAWVRGEGPARLGTRIPGLGSADGAIDLDGPWMADAVATDPDVADFVTRANDWGTTWLAELAAAGDEMWEVGCGW